MTRTLIFCTSYCETETLWNTRYRIWLQAIRGGGIERDHILIIDDGSPVLPNWSDIAVTNRLDSHILSSDVTLYHFDVRLGRQALSVYPGWYRSFCFVAKFAEQFDFDKIVHIESDAFIISPKMQFYMNSICDAWVAPVIESHQFPESAIQIIAGRQVSSFFEFARIPYGRHVGIEAEAIIPFTEIVDEFKGSRYGETLDYVPRNADFVTQTNPSMVENREYHWWIADTDWPLKNDRPEHDRWTISKNTFIAPRHTNDVIRHEGLNYLEFLSIQADILQPQYYLVIGTEAGNSLNAVRCSSISVDPEFSIEQNILEGRPQAHFFQTTSDYFFEHFDLKMFFSNGIDLAFLDGLHHYEVLLRDFYNTERFCHNRSVILLHDCLPINERMAERSMRIVETESVDTRFAWTGDVWKVLLILRKYRPDMTVLHVDCPPTGLIVCAGLNPGSDILITQYEAIVDEFSKFSLQEFGIERLWREFPTVSSRLISEHPAAFFEILFRTVP